MKKKCVFVLGPESTGSKLIGKVCSHAMGIQEFGTWEGSAWSDAGGNKVYHRSLPYGLKPKFPDVDAWVAEHKDEFDISFVLTTRDITISQLSRYQRWKKPTQQAAEESETAKQIMLSVMEMPYPYFIWSYETFMFLGEAYLQTLYKFLDVECSFMPKLIDANAKKVKKARPFS
jgi:hypothetical protein